MVWMELRQLHYFVKVAETLNFSEASRCLYITQSTLSQQIKQLEEEFGIALFERDSHSVSLTENGEKLLPLAQRLLNDAHECISQIQDLQSMVTGMLVVGVTYSFCPILTETARKFVETYPGVKLKIFSMNTEDLMTKLHKGELDLALAFKGNEVYDEFNSQTLFEDKLSVILRRDHPLASRESLRFKDLEQQNIALPGRGLHARSLLDKMMDINRENLHISIELNDISLLLDMVQGGRMLTILSETAIHHRGSLKAIPLDIPNNRIEGCIHTPKRTYVKRSAEAFVKMLMESNEINERINRWL